MATTTIECCSLPCSHIKKNGRTQSNLDAAASDDGAPVPSSDVSSESPIAAPRSIMGSWKPCAMPKPTIQSRLIKQESASPRRGNAGLRPSPANTMQVHPRVTRTNHGPDKDRAIALEQYVHDKWDIAAEGDKAAFDNVLIELNGSIVLTR